MYDWVFTSFRSSLQGRTVAVFCDNTTAVAYLRKVGGTRSPLLHTLAPEILRWTESLSIRLAPQFLPGSNSILADALSRPHQLPHSEWSLNLTVFQSLRRLWPIQNSFYLSTSANHRCFDLLLDIPGSDVSRHERVSPVRGRSSGLHVSLRWLSFRVFSRHSGPSTGTELTLVAPHWAQCPWFSDLLQLSLAPPVVLPARHDLLRLPRSCHLSPDLSRLRLHAWRLSSDFPEPLASTPQSRCSLRWCAVHPRAQYIRGDGPFIVSGITPMAILSLVLPWLR